MANAESTVKFREPPPFRITEQTKLENWKNWLKTYRWYAGATNLSNKSHEEQISIFKSLVGSDAMAIYNTFSLSDITDVESILQKFDDHFTPKVNFTVERLKFNRMVQSKDQNFESFLNDVTVQAEKCNFGAMLNDFLLDKIVVGIDDEEVRNKLLAEENLDYEKALNICRASVQGEFSSKVRSSGKNDDSVDNFGELQNKECSHKNGKKQTSPHKVLPKVRKSDDASVLEEIPKLGAVARKSTRVSRPNPRTIQKRDCETNELKESVNPKKSSDAENNGCVHSDETDDDFDYDDEEDATFEPEVKIKVKKFFNLTTAKKRKKARSRAQVSKGVILLGEKPFACHHCGFKCANKGYIRKHMNIHTAEKLYTCDQCNYKSIRPQGLFRHKFRHTGEKPYACDMCPFRCSHQSSLKKHIMGHTGEKPHACDLCDYRAIVADKLRMHRMKHHTGEKPFKCATCSFACTHKGNLKNHMITHSETRPFACEICDRRFNSNFHLKQHTLTHTGERPFACHMCDFRSAQLGGLRTHMKRHTGEKPHVCHICGHRTSLKGNLKKHMLTHTGEKPYACTICSYRSAQSSGLKTHMKVHTGEKPYVCDACGYRCATNGNLKQHMKTHVAKAQPLESLPVEVVSSWQEPTDGINASAAKYQVKENQQELVQCIYPQDLQRLPVIAERKSVLQGDWSNQNPENDPLQDRLPSIVRLQSPIANQVLTTVQCQDPHPNSNSDPIQDPILNLDVHHDHTLNHRLNPQLSPSQNPNVTFNSNNVTQDLHSAPILMRTLNPLNQTMGVNASKLDPSCNPNFDQNRPLQSEPSRNPHQNSRDSNLNHTSDSRHIQNLEQSYCAPLKDSVMYVQS